MGYLCGLTLRHVVDYHHVRSKAKENLLLMFFPKFKRTEWQAKNNTERLMKYYQIHVILEEIRFSGYFECVL